MRIRTIVVGASLLSFALGEPGIAETLRFELAKTQSCGCCVAYAKRLQSGGYEVEAEDLPMATLIELKNERGVPPELTSCHTSIVGNYVIEGHVPLAEIQRFLAEAPDAIGLAVAGMPLGSPGMEYGDSRDAFDVVLIRKDGSTVVFASYPAI